MTYSAEPKRYYRSTDDKMIAGICGGLAEYLNIDATIVRLIAVLLTLFTSGGGALAYVALIFIVPRRPDLQHSNSHHSRHQSGYRDGRTHGTGTSSGPILDKK